MTIRNYKNKRPQLGDSVFIDDSAQVIGEIDIQAGSSVWMYAVIRGDVNWIKIGRRTNIQDHCMLHVSKNTHPLTIGNEVTVGHHAVLHGCSVGDRVLIGIGARVLDGAIIDDGAMVGAGALVPPGMHVASGELVVGVPARVKRMLRPQELDHIKVLAQRYQDLAQDYRQK